MSTTPISPQSIADLIARYPVALERVYTADAPSHAGPESVFDFPDGLRLIVFRTECACCRDGKMLNVVGGLDENSRLFARLLKRGDMGLRMFADHAAGWFAILSRFQPVTFKDWVEIGGQSVPYWIGEIG